MALKKAAYATLLLLLLRRCHYAAYAACDAFVAFVTMLIYSLCYALRVCFDTQAGAFSPAYAAAILCCALRHILRATDVLLRAITPALYDVATICRAMLPCRYYDAAMLMLPLLLFTPLHAIKRPPDATPRHDAIAATFSPR